ncbi:hypothetical protein CL654_02815 [bacterium]|nr:hypothetical protein [bacterium]|tara:strand:- start:12547 stop:13356 length:810 start_codon:yes stop_codon:yes gene_type:complete
MNNTFDTKWEKIEGTKKGSDEKRLFVDVGETPKTQRQLNLYYYFLFTKRILKEAKAKKVLEVGCGRGTLSLYLSKYLGLETELLDDQEDAIRIAKTAYDEFGQKGVFHTKNVLSTALPSDSYDGLVSIGLAEHFEDPTPLFKEQYRLLKQGGVMVSLNIPKKRSIQELNLVMRWFKKMLGGYKEELRKDYYRNELTAEEYKESAQKAGFKNISIVHVCPFPIFVPVSISSDKMITRIYKLILFIKNVFQKYPFKTNRFIAQAHFLVAYK